MKTNLLKILFLFAVGFLSCDNIQAFGSGPVKKYDLYQTDCTQASAQRDSALTYLQACGDSCTEETFQKYLKAGETEARQMERKYPVLAFYEHAAEKILNEMVSRTVPQGQVYIWCLYNMGYIIKTPSVCFGVDLNHKYACRFAPYIDFLCITHQHEDHIDRTLNDEMYWVGKPVVSNFFPPDSTSPYPYLVKTPGSMEIKGIKIVTNIDDHNSKLKNFVVTYQFDCGKDTKNTVIMHVGDSSFNPKQYSVDQGVDVLIPRYAPTIDQKIIGPVIKPRVILMSHIMELRHVNQPGSRSSIAQGLEHNRELLPYHAYLPFWGELFVYKQADTK